MKCHKKLSGEHKSGAGAKKNRKYMFHDELMTTSSIPDYVPGDKRQEDSSNHVNKQKPQKKEKKIYMN
jgi:hypothetical protein